MLRKCQLAWVVQERRLALSTKLAAFLCDHNRAEVKIAAQSLVEGSNSAPSHAPLTLGVTTRQTKGNITGALALRNDAVGDSVAEDAKHILDKIRNPPKEITIGIGDATVTVKQGGGAVEAKLGDFGVKPVRAKFEVKVGGLCPSFNCN